jgi:hypothetical protein
VVQLHHPHIQSELAKQQAELLVISFAPLERLIDWQPFFQKYFLERYFREQNLEPPDNFFARTRFVSDPQLAAYHAYGLGRHSRLKAYGPKIVWQYLHFITQGKPLRLPHGDTLQKGGDFVVNRQGLITLSHIGRDQSERPEMSDVLAALSR